MSRGDVQTAVQYYKSNQVDTIPSGQIGGIENYANEGMRRIRYICAVPMRFGNDVPIPRVVHVGYGISIKVVSKRNMVGDEMRINSWRLAEGSEESWLIEDVMQQQPEAPVGAQHRNFRLWTGKRKRDLSDN